MALPRHSHQSLALRDACEECVAAMSKARSQQEHRPRDRDYCLACGYLWPCRDYIAAILSALKENVT